MANERPVLVTGVAGFIGSRTARILADSGASVVGLDPSPDGPSGLVRYERMELPDPRLSVLLAEERPRALVHCAGRASVPGSLADPADDFRTNTAMVFETLEAIRTQVPDCHFLFPSSAAVYGDPPSLPVDESAPLAPLSPYGFHKMQAEALCREYATLHGMTTTMLRIFSAYGPGLRRQVLWDICRKALTSSTVLLTGTGSESRDFVFVDDIAGAFSFLMDRPGETGHSTFNLGSGVETSIAGLAEMLIAALGSEVELAFDGADVPGNPRNWQADIGHLREAGFTPSTPLEEGIAAFVPWARAALARD